MEMRGDVQFNYDYMTGRFGLPGYVCSLAAKRLFATVRSQAYAGVYINKHLMRQHPVGGSRSIALSDLQTVPQLFGNPRRFLSGVTRFLYVGYLERVKKR